MAKTPPWANMESMGTSAQRLSTRIPWAMEANRENRCERMRPARVRAAPDSVRRPASRPATATSGRMSARDQGAVTAPSKAAIMSVSKERPDAPMGKTPEASPTPSTCRPVRRQWT